MNYEYSVLSTSTRTQCKVFRLSVRPTMASARSAVLASYRNLMRSQRTAFANDVTMQAGARQEIRQHYLQNAHVTDEAELEALVKAADDAADFLVTGIVQGTLNDAGGYDTQVEARHLQSRKGDKPLELHPVPESVAGK